MEMDITTMITQVTFACGEVSYDLTLITMMDLYNFMAFTVGNITATEWIARLGDVGPEGAAILQEIAEVCVGAAV